MIEVKIKDYNEDTIINILVEKMKNDLIGGGYPWSDDPIKRITPFHAFKNQVANLVADKIYKDILDGETLDSRIEEAINKVLKVRVNKILSSNKGEVCIRDSMN